MRLFNFYKQPPEEGTRFIAFYSDGSGAELFMRTDNGDYIKADSMFAPDTNWFIDSGYLWFARLPDDFRLFFEDDNDYESSITAKLTQPTQSVDKD